MSQNETCYEVAKLERRATNQYTAPASENHGFLGRPQSITLKRHKTKNRHARVGSLKNI
jgi:hypothetical protein